MAVTTVTGAAAVAAAAGGGGGGGAEDELDGSVVVADPQADQVYDPCFVLPLLEFGLRSAGVKAQAVSRLRVFHRF